MWLLRLVRSSFITQDCERRVTATNSIPKLRMHTIQYLMHEVSCTFTTCSAAVAVQETYLYIDCNYPASCCCSLDEQLLNLVLQALDLLLELRGLVSGHRCADDRARHTAGSAKGDLRGHKDVRDVLVLTQQWQVQQDLQGLCVCCHDDELADAAVQRLGGCSHIETRQRRAPTTANSTVS
jgi:hypothetical protein